MAGQEFTRQNKGGGKGHSKQREECGQRPLRTKWHSADKRFSLYSVGNEEEPLTGFRQGWQYGQTDILQRHFGSKEGGEWIRRLEAGRPTSYKLVDNNTPDDK